LAAALAIVLKGYPRLSETFIAQEILNLESSGFEITLFSLRHPTDGKTHPVHDEIRAAVIYLPEYLYQEPWRVFRSWMRTRGSRGFRQARTVFWKDLKRDPSCNRIRRFGQAMVLAAELPANIYSLYAHFLHTPGSVTRYAAIMGSMPWACSAHAKDIYTTPDWEIREKLQDCHWLTTCTRSNVEYLRKNCELPDKISLNYHGLDLERFNNLAPNFSRNDGASSIAPVVILSVGRAVEKKGYSGLLKALKLLDSAIHWKLVHIGDGPLLTELKQQANELGLKQNIEWLGAQSQQTVLHHYQQSDLFVLNCCIDRHGDRDGLPNVMVEAQSQALPIVATTISGIPELVEHGVNGLLIESGEEDTLALALQTLVTSPVLRRQMGEAGRKKVLQQFEMKACFTHLEKMVRELITR
jgi:glycosyltransferase involved in cell wall biosynthesis